jgi:hypothetical protein
MSFRMMFPGMKVKTDGSCMGVRVFALATIQSVLPLGGQQPVRAFFWMNREFPAPG